MPSPASSTQDAPALAWFLGHEEGPNEAPGSLVARHRAPTRGASQPARATSFPAQEGSRPVRDARKERGSRSEEHTSELQSLMRTSYAVFCLKKKKKTHH